MESRIHREVYVRFGGELSKSRHSNMKMGVGSLAYDMTADSYVDFSDLEAIRLQKAILSLPRKQQLAFNLRYYDEMDYDQIAQVAETTATTARVNYHLAKEKIIRYMQQEL